MYEEGKFTVFRQPDRLRRQAMRLLSTTVEKGVSLAIALSESGQTAHYTYINADDGAAQKALQAAQGNTPELGSFASKADGASWRRGSWTITELPVDQWNQFKLLDEVAIRERALTETETWTRYYGPMGVRDQMRMVVVRRGRLLGWLGLIGDDFYNELDKHRANQIAPKLAGWMSEAASIEEALFMEHSAHVVARPDGHFEYASEAALHFLAEREQKLRSYLARVRPGVSMRTTFEGVELRVSAMRAPSGWLKLVSFAAPRFVTQRALVGLSERQKEVALLLSKGSTMAEVGALLGISTSTVKYHSRAVHEALGVADRVELAKALADSD